MPVADKTTAAGVRSRAAVRAEANKLWLDDTTPISRVQHRYVPPIIGHLARGALDVQVATILQVNGAAAGHIRRAIARAMSSLECADWVAAYERTERATWGRA